MGLGNQPNEPEWMALPSGACCLKGHLHSGKPRGTFEQVKDLETYVARPSPDKDNGNVIIYYPDVFGFFTNGLLIMDEMADAGYTTIGIDYFQGVSDEACLSRGERQMLTLPGPGKYPSIQVGCFGLWAETSCQTIPGSRADSCQIYLYRDGPKQPKADFNFEAWLAEKTKFADSAVPGWVDAVKEKYGKSGTKYACVG